MVKQRKIPQRKCIVTNELKSKQEMIRIVRNKDKEVFIDPTGKQNGRGAYITLDKAIIQKAADDKVLNKAFGQAIDATLYEALMKLVDSNE